MGIVKTHLDPGTLNSHISDRRPLHLCLTHNSATQIPQQSRTLRAPITRSRTPSRELLLNSTRQRWRSQSCMPPPLCLSLDPSSTPPLHPALPSAAIQMCGRGTRGSRASPSSAAPPLTSSAATVAAASSSTTLADAAPCASMAAFAAASP